MSIRTRSLFSNSLSSIISSGLLIFSTVLVPAILVRSIGRPEYDFLSTILAALPLLSIVPQSLRSAGASQLALAYGYTTPLLASRVYLRFSLIIATILAVAALIGSEVYVFFDKTYIAHSDLLRFGLYCVAGHALGLIMIGVLSGPAAARGDFLPENFAKLWPGVYHLVGIAIVWLVKPPEPLIWICLVYLSSSWTAVIILAIRLWRVVYTHEELVKGWREARAEKMFWSGLRGSTWWNLTAYMATSAAIFIVSLQHPKSIVPFSIAYSVIGIMSAGLIAVSSPISVYAVGMRDRDATEQRRFFLIVNTLFQFYIVTTVAIVLLVPQKVFDLWLGPGLADEMRYFCNLLAPAYGLRLLTMAFTVFVMSAGRQETLWLSPLVEALMSVGGCLLLGATIGVEGIPIALTISAGVRLAMTLWHDEPTNAQALGLRRGDTMLSGFRLLGAK